MLDTECSLGERLLLIEVLGNAASALSNEKDLELEPQYKEAAITKEEN